jgi:aspartate kinase
VSFEEAAELAFYGARVLHPASVAPAVRLGIPVRVLNSMRPEGSGTLLVEDAPSHQAPLAVASRDGVVLVRLTARLDRKESGFPLRIMGLVADLSLTPDLLVASEASITLTLPTVAAADELRNRIGDEASIEWFDDRAILCVVGSALSNSSLRREALEGLARWEPDLVTVGASRISVVGVLRQTQLESALCGLHRQFFERSPAK